MKDSTNHSQISAEKLELLAYLLEEEGIELQDQQKISRRENSDQLPLSFAQARLWFLNQLTPGTSTYNIPAALRISGELDAMVLEQSLNEILQRHEALRTTFLAVDEQPVQIIHPAPTFKLSVIDLQDSPETEQQSQTLLLAAQEAQQPFDLTQAPLLRAKLLRLSAEEHVLFLTMHHIVSDGWSLGVLLREVAVLYDAFCCGRSLPLPELSIQYADFALWQRQWLQGEVLEEKLAYWKQQLGGSLPILELPTDRPRPATQTFRGAKQALMLPKSLSVDIAHLSQQAGVTLFMTLLTAFKTLLYRYTGQEDILVGSPIANRNQTETEQVIGFFINTLVLRTDLGGNPTFRELLLRVRQVVLGAYDYQDVPFEKLVETLQPERTLSHTPLFQVMFALQNTPMPALEFAGLKLNPLEVDNQTAKFDLTLDLSETPNGIAGWVEYNTDLFDTSTISRMVGHFQKLLEGIVANPEQQLSNLPLLTAAEQHQILVEWNDTNAEYPNNACIHQLFEAQVERTPDAVAVVFENEQLTYRELNSRANQLAHHLQTLGVEPDMLVGICVERSLSMVVGILGILKAGGAYVPLDPAYPQERLAFIIEDAQMPILLSQKPLLEKLPSHSAQVVCLDTDWESVAQQSQKNPICGAVANNLAYVIYTSGSTGKPKGILVNHANVIRLFAATQHWYHFNEQDVWTLFHSYAFDFSVWELWGALLFGGRLVVVPYLISRSPAAFYDLLSKEQVTVLNQTPSAFRQLMKAEESLGTVKDLNLRLVIFGGEALEIQSLKPWWERHGDQFPQLVNMYGITETTVHVTYRPLTMVDLRGTGSIIGRPIPDLQVYVLDQYRQPVPIGVPGEMYIGGAGVTHGYLNRPELTAERFISNPFNDKPDARLYKSGDLARNLPNGDIEYLGRIDHQVKIRGFRIELGEIEAVLAQHPAVRQSVVLVREDELGDKRLVAYLVAAQPAPTINELRSFLMEQMPDYMLPSAFIVLEALPLLPNGKLDRRSLPAPEHLRPELAVTYVAPRTELEQTIATIWQEVLQLEKVGLHDNFFDLGGHSLLIVQVHSKLRQILHQDVSMLEMFKYPTVSALAKYLSQEKSDILESFSEKNNNQLEDIKEGRNRLKQRLARSPGRHAI